MASATLIDTFSDGMIVNTSAPQLIDQAGLSGVIGSGDRRTNWSVSSGPGSVDLDVNSFVPENALLSSSAATSGLWLFV